jgi:hypothetical protein
MAFIEERPFQKGGDRHEMLLQILAAPNQYGLFFVSGLG